MLIATSACSDDETEPECKAAADCAPIVCDGAEIRICSGGKCSTDTSICPGSGGSGSGGTAAGGGGAGGTSAGGNGGSPTGGSSAGGMSAGGGGSGGTGG